MKDMRRLNAPLARHPFAWVGKDCHGPLKCSYGCWVSFFVFLRVLRQGDKRESGPYLVVSHVEINPEVWGKESRANGHAACPPAGSQSLRNPKGPALNASAGCCRAIQFQHIFLTASLVAQDAPKSEMFVGPCFHWVWDQLSLHRHSWALNASRRGVFWLVTNRVPHSRGAPCCQPHFFFGPPDHTPEGLGPHLSCSVFDFVFLRATNCRRFHDVPL